ncbi:IS5/IS1182 family transposase, partial [Brevibacillus sp. MCWH]|nr:IS5/IS1182 family transposase [Brevibacillus sp. MCWH]NNV04618.1 IS5/IS1182 family transposase [Brevibacillus sp. MCWH]
TLRGLKKVTMQAMLVFACMNLKKLANWLWKAGKGRHNAFHFRFIFEYIQDKNSLDCQW